MCNPALQVVRCTSKRKETKMTANSDYLGLAWWRAVMFAAIALLALAAGAAEYPAPKEGSWVARDFRFHTGQMMSELRLNYVTIGAATGEPVLLLHGTAGSAASMLTPA